MQAVPSFMDVNLLRGIELTSSSTIWTVGVLAVLTAVVAAVLLPWTLPAATGDKPSEAPDVPEAAEKPAPVSPTIRHVLRTVGRYTARTIMVGTPVLLVVVLGGLLINLPMHYVRTLGDVIEAAGYAPPADLPPFLTYLRTHYRHMPSQAQQELVAAFERIAKKYDLTPHHAGPAPGQDETTDFTPRRHT